MGRDDERAFLARLQSALSVPAGEREPLIAAIRDVDPDERRRLRDLVRRAEADERRDAARADGTDAAGDDAQEGAFGYLRALSPGVTLGDFRLVRRLGEGGMGQVWEAHQLSVDRPVALKLLKSGVLPIGGAVKRLRREARIAAHLDHAGVIAVHVAGEIDGVPFVAHELVRGGRDLRAWVRERDAAGPPPDHAREAAALMADVADAVHAAHEAGIVHRDLKPTNIMLREDGRPVVLDFGLAGVVARSPGDVTGRRVVSPAYQAPEQIRSRATGKDPRTDVYQLGVTLYELVTLRRAFGDSDRTALERRIVQADFPRPRAVARSVPADLEVVCLHAMALAPEHRYGTAGELRDDLRRFVEGRELPHAARGGPLVAALRRAPYVLRRHRVVTLVASALLLGLLAGGLAWAGGGDGVDVRPFRRTGDGASIVSWDASDEARAGDQLCVDLALERAATVYALSAFGDRSPPSWVQPVDPATREALIAGDAAARARSSGDPWGLPLAPGRHELVVSVLGEASRAVAHEGLVLLVTDEPSPVLELWLSDLDRAGRVSSAVDQVSQPGVAYEQARRLLDGLDDPSRGGRVAALTPRQLAGLARFRAADVLAADELTLDGVHLQRVMWRVVP